MSVHYKFKSALSFDTIAFDGLHISVRDLKKSILQQKQIGKATDFDLQITNAQSNEVYDDENALIPKNSSLIVVRVPLTAQQKKNWEKTETLPALNSKQIIGNDVQDPVVTRLAKTVDLTNVDASEGAKIQAAITQSALDYDPSNYLRIKGSNQVGELPANYRCYKCLQPGHWIKDCKLNAQQDAIEIKKSTGIPRSFMVPVEGPEVPGAMMTPTGQFAVPSIEHEARREPLRKPLEPAALEKPTIPDDLLCGVCKDLLTEAVLIPCCGNSFCDECIRNLLLESEEHQCPDCKEKGVSPDTLIPNRFLRNSVNNFKNQTGYIRTHQVKQAVTPAQPQQPIVQQPPSTLIPVHVMSEVPPPMKRHSPLPYTPASPDKDEHIGVSDGEDKHHMMKEKSGGYMNKRGDRSGTPTIDERSNERYHNMNHNVTKVYLNQGHGKNQQQMHHSNPPPGMNNNVPQTSMQQHNVRGPHPIHPRGGNSNNFMYTRQPHFGNRGGRAPPMPYSYQPGGHPHLRGAPPFRGRAMPPVNRPHIPNTPNISTILKGGPIDDPLELFERLMSLQDKRRAQRRSHSRSFSRSRSITPRSPRRLRSRTRSRSRTRARTRTRSHSRSPVRRRRSRSRSISLSRSSSRSPRSRSQVSRSPSPSRDRRDYSPRRRSEYRSSPRQTPPTRYYSQRYKEEQYNNVNSSSRNGRGRYPSKSQDYYSQDCHVTREVDRFSLRDREQRAERERSERTDRLDRMERSDRDRIERSERIDRSERSDRFDRSDRSEKVDRLDRDRLDRERDRSDRERVDRDRDRIDRERDRGDRERIDRERDRGEKDRFDRIERERLDRDRLDRERISEKDREREKERDRERDRGYASYKRYEAFDPMRDYEHSIRDMARDWEKTRDREIEMREKEKQQSEYYRKREQRGNPVEILETSREPIAPPGVPEEERDRVLIDLSTIRAEPLEKPRTPEKEKKPKEKKKKKKEDSERKKKKKKLKDKLEKKESLEEGEIASDKPDIEIPVAEVEVKKDELYGDLGANIDQYVVENYNKPPPFEEKKELIIDKDVMLAPVPELSKWEKDEDLLSHVEENKRISQIEDKQVTSEIIARAMNVIIKKSVKPIEKKVEKKSDVRERRSREREKDKREEKSSDRFSKDAPKSVAHPVKTEYERKRSSSKSRTVTSSKTAVPSSGRISAKDRLGAKIEDKVVVKKDVRGDRREIKIEKVPKSVVRREKENSPERAKSSSRDHKRSDSKLRDSKPIDNILSQEEKKNLEDTTFEPDYEKSDHETEVKKREEPSSEIKKRSSSVERGAEPKKLKVDAEDKVSSEDSSLSSDDSSRSHRKKKKKKHKKKKSKKKRHDSTSESDSSDSSSPSESERKKKKHKHKSHKKSKKRKKSKK